MTTEPQAAQGAWHDAPEWRTAGSPEGNRSNQGSVRALPWTREEALPPRPPAKAIAFAIRPLAGPWRGANRGVSKSVSAPLQGPAKSMVPRATALGGGPGGKASWWGSGAKPRCFPGFAQNRWTPRPIASTNRDSSRRGSTAVVGQHDRTGEGHGLPHHLAAARRVRGTAVVGHPHGAKRGAACLRGKAPRLPRPRSAQQVQGVPRRGWRHGHPAEQHRDRPHGDRLCGGRPRGAGAGARGDAWRQRRHDPDRAVAIVQRRRAGAGAYSGRGHDVPARLGRPARLRPGSDRPWTDVDGAADLPQSPHSLRGRSQSASAFGRHRDAAGAGCHPRGRTDMGRAFQRRGGVGDHVLRRAGNRAAGGCVRARTGRQSRHRHQSRA